MRVATSRAPRPRRAFALCAAAALLFGCGGAEAPPPASAPAAALETVTVGEDGAGAAELALDGVVEAVEQATLSAQTAGRVADTPFDVGDAVRRGETVLRLRASEQVAGLGQAQAALAAARARDAEARAQFDRLRDMYERRVVARATYDGAVTAREAAAAEVAAAEAALEAAREGVAYTDLRAPFDGRVLARPVQPGEAVAPGTPLLTVAALGALRVVVDVPQAHADAVRTAREAHVTVADARVAATRVTLFPSADPQTGTFRARVELPADAPGLAPGMRARVAFATEGVDGRLLVPRRALVERSELRALYVLDDEGRVALRQVRLGRTHGDQVEILAGIARGERVALDPAAATLALREAARE